MIEDYCLCVFIYSPGIIGSELQRSGGMTEEAYENVSFWLP